MLEPLVKRAAEKQQRGEKLSREEQRALDRWKKDQALTRGQAFVAAVPKKVYRQYAGGRQHKQLDDHARAYGVPCQGDTVDLGAVIAWLHNFLVDRKEELRTLDGSGGSLKDQLTRIQIEGEQKKNEKYALDLAERRAELVPITELRDVMVRAANLLSRLGDYYRRKPTLTGVEASEQLAKTLEDFAATIEPITNAAGEKTKTEAPSDKPA